MQAGGRAMLRAPPPSPPGTATTLLGKRRSHCPTAAEPSRARLPAKTSLYHSTACVSADAERTVALAGATSFSVAAPPGTTMRVLEYQLMRPVMLLHRPPSSNSAPPGEEELRALGCDGWCEEGPVAEPTITLWLPASDGGEEGKRPLLRLVDDDKQAGLTQASLPDLFLRLQLRSKSGGSTSAG